MFPLTIHRMETLRDVPQPDPERQVLCSGENNYENTCYCYADQLPISIICTLIFTVTSAIVFILLSFLCHIPMTVKNEQLLQPNLVTSVSCLISIHN